MAKIACCYYCAFSYWDREHTAECISKGVMNWPACANQPESHGRTQRTPPRGICVNYRPRAAKAEGDVKQIPLGGGFYTYVDAGDYEWLSQWTWHLRCGYAARFKGKKPILMHRQIMQPPEDMVVDHRNRNKLDNTRINLWVCTQGENSRNRGKPTGTSSRFHGVTYRKECGKYRSLVYCKGELFSCGSFNGEIEAARAYDRKAVELLGEAARLNFPEEWPPERRAQVYAHPDAVKARRQAKRKRGRKQAGAGGRLRSRSSGRKSRATAGGTGSRS